MTTPKIEIAAENIHKGDLSAKSGEVYPYTEITGNVDARYVKNFNKAFPNIRKIGGDLDLRSLTSLPAGFKFPQSIGGVLYLSSLTSIPPIKTNDAKARETAVNKCRSMLMASFAAAGFSFADGIMAKIVSQRGPVSRVVICGKTDISYLITDGESWSHGKTLAEARDGLLFKIGKRDPSEFKAWTLEKVVSKRDAIRAYRVITGACEGGVRAWMEQHKTPEAVSVKEIITLTAGAYGADAFKGFFEKAS